MTIEVITKHSFKIPEYEPVAMSYTSHAGEAGSPKQRISLGVLNHVLTEVSIVANVGTIDHGPVHVIMPTKTDNTTKVAGQRGELTHFFDLS